MQPACQRWDSASLYIFLFSGSLHSNTLYYTACTKHFPVLLFPVLLCTTKLAQSPSQYYFVLQSLHKALPSTTLYYKACINYFPVLLCTTKLAQSTSQYYFVLQSLHKLLPSTLYYKACTKHFPVLLCTTKLAQSTSQHYFVLQSLQKLLPSTTLYYKACTMDFPVLLCTTKLAQSTSQYYFTYYKACTKHFSVLLCTTKLAQSTSQYYFVLQSLHKLLPSTTLCYKLTWQPAWKPSKRRGFAASPIDTEFTTRRRRDADPKTTRRRPDDDATSHSRRTRVQPPDPQTINGNPSLRIREKQDNLGWTSKIIKSPAQRHLTYN